MDGPYPQLLTRIGAPKTDLLESYYQPRALSVHQWCFLIPRLSNMSELAHRMLENQKIRAASVMGPLGEPLTLETLPPPSTTRWVIRRKAEVVAAVRGSLLSIDEACDRYSISFEEFTGWQRAVERSGMPGLRVTRIKHYRALHESDE